MTPTKIQELAVPLLSTGQSAILHAQTGSGKTLAYLLPLTQIVDPLKNRVQAIILAPSRELVTQIQKVAQRVFAGTDFRTVGMIGGANARNQLKQLREQRPQILVATPGRLAEFVFKLEKLRLGNLRALIIDEADNLLQDPFIGELQTIIEASPLYRRNLKKTDIDLHESDLEIDLEDVVGDLQDDDDNDDENIDELDEIDKEIFHNNVNSNKQVSNQSTQQQSTGQRPLDPRRKLLLCLASATANNPTVTSFAEKYTAGIGGFQRVTVSFASALPPTITHSIISTPRIRAFEQLRKLLVAEPEVGRALIFVNDPHRVQIVHEKLLEMNIISAPLHGDSSKDDRKVSAIVKCLLSIYWL